MSSGTEQMHESTNGRIHSNDGTAPEEEKVSANNLDAIEDELKNILEGNGEIAIDSPSKCDCIV